METYLEVGEKFFVYPKENAELQITPNSSGVLVEAVPKTILPGTVLFESTFEEEDYPKWIQEFSLWENGNTNTHPKSIIPDEMGLKSLRCKQDNGNAGGNFPLGAYDSASRVVPLGVFGNLFVRLWRVAHDVGTYVFSVLDEYGNVLGRWEGTDGLTVSEWTPTDHPFFLAQPGNVTLKFEYTAPPFLTTQSGVKCALLQIIAA